jgi:VanZ family protein
MNNFFSKYKFIFYSLNIILIFVYLFPGSIFGLLMNDNIHKQPQITPDFIISTNHLYSFFILSLVGFLTFGKKKQFKILSIYLIFLSIILELSHIIIPNRGFELSDLFGNLLGVIISIFLKYFFKKDENI